ncbi:uncharacterized protein MRET_2075 [Malassezia restricta]|uniref:uncharacterized protein n=1 Tax=Malassezia restricta TaxID=76775 RepID=UPI000DD13FAE|nr:uncharacterized protein MRET_2075 [Malassezia restricta]AXA49902.1 uncharacterized protein MRET_2075 [Malassezia restricta]
MSSLASGVAPASESSGMRQRHAPQGGKVIDRTTKAIQREPEPKSQAFYAPLVDTVWRVYVMASGILGTSVQEPVEILIMLSVYAIVLSGVCLALYHFPNYVQNASRRVHYYLTGEQPVQ